MHFSSKTRVCGLNTTKTTFTLEQKFLDSSDLERFSIEFVLVFINNDNRFINFELIWPSTVALLIVENTDQSKSQQIKSNVGF